MMKLPERLKNSRVNYAAASLLILAAAGFIIYGSWRYRIISHEHDFLRAKTPERLLAVIEKYESAYPEKVEDARVTLANLYVARKRFAEARELYRILSEKATYRELELLSRFNYGCTYVFEGVPEQAVEPLAQLLMEPGLPNGFATEVAVTLGGVLLRIGREDAAGQLLSQVVAGASPRDDAQTAGLRRRAAEMLRKDTEGAPEQ